MLLIIHAENSIKRLLEHSVNAAVVIMTLLLYFFFYHLQIHSEIFMDKITCLIQTLK